MLYLDYWNSFWKEWADLALSTSPNEPELPPTNSNAGILSREEKYHYLTQYGTQILGILSAKEGCLYLSQNFASLTGLDAEKCLGEAFFSIIHEDFRGRLKAVLEEAKEKHASPLRCKLQHGDKKWYWHQFHIHPKQDASDQCICIIEDINDSVMVQHTLQKARLEAELALRARSEFLSNMSHDLRTPLNAVIGFSQIIESEMFGKLENPQYLEYARHIQESGYDLLAKIEDMLEIANIDAGRVTLTQAEVYAGDILRQVVATQKHHADAGRISIDIAPVPADILLYVDRLKLQHILGHITANAIKHSREGGCVSLACEKTGDGQVRLTVRDNGAGMPEAKLDAIIAALKEDHCWTADNNRAIGLGLALTREFVALHGGLVDLFSRVGEGTAVTITLPENCVRSALVNTADYLKQVAN